MKEIIYSLCGGLLSLGASQAQAQARAAEPIARGVVKILEDGRKAVEECVVGAGKNFCRWVDQVTGKPIEESGASKAGSAIQNLPKSSGSSVSEMNKAAKIAAPMVKAKAVPAAPVMKVPTEGVNLLASKVSSGPYGKEYVLVGTKGVSHLANGKDAGAVIRAQNRAEAFMSDLAAMAAQAPGGKKISWKYVKDLPSTKSGDALDGLVKISENKKTNQLEIYADDDFRRLLNEKLNGKNLEEGDVIALENEIAEACFGIGKPRAGKPSPGEFKGLKRHVNN